MRFVLLLIRLSGRSLVSVESRDSTRCRAECRTHPSNVVAIITVPRIHSDIRLPCNYLPLPHNRETSHFSFQLISNHQYLSKQIFFSIFCRNIFSRIFQTLQTHFTTDVYRFQRIKSSNLLQRQSQGIGLIELFFKVISIYCIEIKSSFSI